MQILSDIFLLLILFLILFIAAYMIILVVHPSLINESDYFIDVKLYFDRAKYYVIRKGEKLCVQLKKRLSIFRKSKMN